MFFCFQIQAAEYVVKTDCSRGVPASEGVPLMRFKPE